MRFYECKTCGNVMVLFEDSGVLPVCCGSTMTEVKCQYEDGSKEKHVPVVEVNGNEVIVRIGENLHPMSDDHYIKWVVLETNKGKYIRSLKPGLDPIAKFYLTKDETPLIAYEFCNIHGLWTKEL